MADEISLTIGPAGEPPVTIYTYSDGSISLSPRDAVEHNIEELRTVVERIKAFAKIVTVSTFPPKTVAEPPFIYRFIIENDAPNTMVARFRCPATVGNLTVDASINLETKIINFDARPGKTINWSDFELFIKWMSAIYEAMSRG